MTSGELKDYLYRVYLLEKSLYQQKTLTGQLKKQICDLESRKDSPMQATRNSRDVWAGENIKNAAFFSFFALSIIVVLYGVVSAIFNFHFYLGNKMLVIISLTIFILLIFLQLKFQALRIKKENLKIAKENQSLQIQNAQNRELAVCRAAILRQELQVLDRSIIETKQILSRYYSRNIIFPKYREIVAVSSFYEYLASGRCSTLEGHEGAYNIFESESRQDLILRKLDDIIERLDRIEGNQYMLYTAIRDSGQDTRRMLAELNRTTQNIESNSAITAYNSGIAAQNAECLKWLAVLQA